MFLTKGFVHGREDLCMCHVLMLLHFSLIPVFIFTVFVYIFLRRPDVFESVRNTVKCVMKGLKGKPNQLCFIEMLSHIISVKAFESVLFQVLKLNPRNITLMGSIFL